MTLWQIIALAVLQGLTEFLPISSWAHLILAPKLVGWDDQGLVFDVAVHIGTLAAVLIYFRTELTAMARGWGRSLLGDRMTAEARLAWFVLFGTIPAGLAGLLLNRAAETTLRSPLVIAWATIGFGLLLWWADARAARARDERTLTWTDALVIGTAQAIALIPGTSRSGITITAGLLLGLTRSGAARFSFLLSIPVIALSGGLEALKLTHEPVVHWADLGLGALISGVSAYLCIHYFLRLLDRIGLWPFAVYRLFLGGLLIYLFADF